MYNSNQDLLLKNSLPLRLKPVFIGQITLVDSLSDFAYSYDQDLREFTIKLRPDEGITPEFVKNFALTQGKTIFISNNDFLTLKEKLKDNLMKLTRSLSMGDSLKNASRHTNLLTMQMANLYQEPFNNELLTDQFQNTKNLSTLLYKNKNIQKSVYHNISKQGHHYTHTQPLQSSILLLGFLQNLGVFSEKEIQNLFLTSYFKDIGMSFIPREKLDLVDLDDFDKIIFSEHATNSMKILEGRVPMTRNQLNIIENHHYLNYKIQARAQGKVSDHEFLSGIESALISSIDILVAMTNSRPYRESISPFKALELLKHVLADEYPQEFKHLVVFLKSFFTK